MGNSGRAAPHGSALPCYRQRCTVQSVRSGARQLCQRPKPTPATNPTLWPSAPHIKALFSPADREPACTPDHNGQQTVDARLRQAHGLLSSRHTDAGGYSNILVITTPRDQLAYVDLRAMAASGASGSVHLQASPDGLAQAFLLAEEFIDRDPVCSVLGDNILYGRSHHQTEACRGARGGARLRRPRRTRALRRG